MEKRNVFLDEHDYFRFLLGLYEFNDENPSYKYSEAQINEIEVRKQFILKERERVVDIYSFCLMDNHFHLEVRQIKENGIVTLMHKLGTGYTNCFNKKYDRVGHLFQGPFKAVHIKEESQLQYLLYYIHANPLDLKMPGWREDGIQDCGKAMQVLERYKYSSHHDYLGKRNYELILETEFLQSILGGPEEYKNNMFEWLKSRRIEDADKYTLE